MQNRKDQALHGTNTLKNWQAVQQFAENIVELVSYGCLYSSFTKTIAQAGLAGEEHPEDYWINLGAEPIHIGTDLSYAPLFLV